MSTAVAAPARLGPRSAPCSLVKALFYVVGAADPGLLPRVIEPVAKMGYVPARVHASREAGDGSEMAIDLRLTGVTASTAQRVEHALRSTVGVRQVIAVVETDE